MRYPLFIQKGDTIGYVAPSFGCATEPYRSAFDNARKKLGRRGFGAQLGPNCYEASGCGISNTPELCAKELMEMYEDPANAALIACGGGELMCEILPYMDFGRIREADPKWVMGFSDITNFTFLSATLCDTAAIYGINAPGFGMEPWHQSVKDTLALLKGETNRVHSYGMWELEGNKDAEHPLLPYNLTKRMKIKGFLGKEEISVAKGGSSVHMEGRLIGGCLDCLSNLVGTKYDKVAQFNERYQDDGIIWFLEACDLNNMGIRRALWQLREAGWFDKAAGFLIGRPYNYGQSFFGMDQYNAVTEVIGELGVPILMDLDIGHLPPRMPLVAGATANMVCRDNRFELEYTWK